MRQVKSDESNRPFVSRVTLEAKKYLALFVIVTYILYGDFHK